MRDHKGARMDLGRKMLARSGHSRCTAAIGLRHVTTPIESYIFLVRLWKGLRTGATIFSVLARLCRLARCSKSAAIRGRPVVALNAVARAAGVARIASARAMPPA